MNTFKVFLMLICSSLFAIPCQAAMVTLQAGAGGQSSEIIEDAMLVQNSSTLNYGGRPNLEVGVAGNGQVRTSVMRFDVTDPTLGLYVGGVPQFSSIDAVSLQLTITGQTINQAISNNMDVRISAAVESQGDWVEGTANAVVQNGSVTYSDRQYNTLDWVPNTNYTRGTGDGILGTITAWPGLNNAVTVNFTAPGGAIATLDDLINRWATGNNEGILINDFGRSGFVRWFFNSSEASTVSARPLLTIEYTSVPEPNTWALLIAGTFGVALLMRRHRVRSAA